MNRKSTIMWRLAVLGLIASLVPLGIYALDKHGQVDTERMLDVSVSIRTMSHVTVDKFGDSVWEIGNGSGFLVASGNCEVWTNHHVIEGAALICGLFLRSALLVAREARAELRASRVQPADAADHRQRPSSAGSCG